MSFALSSKKKLDAAAAAAEPSKFNIKFHDGRNATFFLDGVPYPASLLDLPCLAETHKYTEKRTFYKSGDIGQMLVVRMPGEPAPKDTTMTDGITPGGKGARQRFAVPPPVFKQEQVSSIENTLKLVVDNKLPTLIRKKPDSEGPNRSNGDNAQNKEGAVGDQAASSAGTAGVPGKGNANEEEIEIVIEPENAAVAKEEVDGSAKSAGNKPTDPAKRLKKSKSSGNSKVKVAAKSKQAGKGDSREETKIAANLDAQKKIAKHEVSLASGSNSETLLPSTAPAVESIPGQLPPSEAAAPDPGEVGDVGGGDDDDDFANMLAESMLGEGQDDGAPMVASKKDRRPVEEDPSAAADALAARVARAALAKKIDEKRGQVASEASALARAPNPVLKNRHSRRKAELEAQLATLVAEEAALK